VLKEGKKNPRNGDETTEKNLRRKDENGGPYLQHIEVLSASRSGGKMMGKPASRVNFRVEGIDGPEGVVVNCRALADHRHCLSFFHRWMPVFF